MKPVAPPSVSVASESAWSADTDQGEASDPAPRALYQRLKLIAGLLKDAGPLPKPGRYLIWRGEDGQVQHRLIDRDLVIGRASDCDIVLDDPRISRRHALIRHHSEADILVDLDSANGTVINGLGHTSPCILCDGNVIAAGGTALLHHDRREIEP